MGMISEPPPGHAFASGSVGVSIVFTAPLTAIGRGEIHAHGLYHNDITRSPQELRRPMREGWWQRPLESRDGIGPLL
jgi:hypothetical protein